MRTVFITRNLSPNSDFRHQLETAGWQVCGQSFVLFEPIPFELPAPFDWIFFSSQQAVHFFFAQVAPSFFHGHSALQWGALGTATALALSEHIGQVDFAGNGDPIASAKTFGAVAKGKRVLFPGAIQSRESVQTLLKDSVRATTMAIYHNTPVENPGLRTEDVLVFTSPMNVSAYFGQQALRPHQRCVAIGQTTRLALQEYRISDLVVASVPTELGLAQAVVSLSV